MGWPQVFIKGNLMGKHVCILGHARSTRMQAPFDNPEVEIHHCNPMCSLEGFTDVPRWDLWFDLHPDNMVIPGYKEWIDKHRDKVILREDYPWEEVVARYGKYFNNSISLMMAKAALDGATRIDIFGVDMCHFTEYGGQRPSCEFIIGFLRGEGIEVTVPVQSDLLKCRYIYGLEQPGDFEAKLNGREGELNEQRERIGAKYTESIKLHASAMGGLGEVDRLAAETNGDEKLAKSLQDRRKELLEVGKRADFNRNNLRQHLNRVEGAITEFNYFREWI